MSDKLARSNGPTQPSDGAPRSQELAGIPTIQEIRAREEGSQEWLQAVNPTMVFRPASEVVISCGTVTFDIEREMVLLIWKSTYAIYQLPKGRRKIGETLWDAALRETREETRYAVELPELNIATRAESRKPKHSGHLTSSITDGEYSREFIGACFYPDPQSPTPADKIVYFFAAVADSTAEPEVGGPQEGENVAGIWAPLRDVDKMVFFDAERETIWKGKSDVEKSGYRFGEKAAPLTRGKPIMSANGTPRNGTLGKDILAKV